MESPQFEEQSLTVSADLVRFIEWLFENEQETLRLLIKKSIKSSPPVPTSAPSHYNVEDVKEHIGQFFNLFETIVQETVQEELAQHTIHQFLVPSINHVDLSQCSTEVITKSIEVLPHDANIKHSPKTTKELFCKALLKNWSPQSNKQNIVN